MARKKECSKCGAEKDDKHRTSGYCRSCASARRKAATTKKRLSRGLQPWGSKRRKAACCSCGGPKERPQAGYCNKCRREKDKQWRLRTGRTKKARSGKCRCGKPFASYSKYLCSDCATKNRKEYLDRNPEVRLKLNEKAAKRRERPDEKFKYHARQMVRLALRNGLLEKDVCSICGIDKVDAHHEDYTQPLKVVWLCRKHHLQLHKMEK